MRLMGAFTRAWINSASLKPLAFLWKTKYDETKLRIRGRLAQGGAKVLQTTQTFVVESSWTCVFQVPRPAVLEAAVLEQDEFVSISGFFSPQVRHCDRNNSSALLAVLQSCPSPSHPFSATFPHRFRIVESDALAANAKSERRLATLQTWEGMLRFSYYCCAHRAHQGATRVLEMPCWKPIVSGMTHTSIFLAGRMSELHTVLANIIRERFVMYQRAPHLTQEDMAARHRAARIFCPPTSSARLWFQMMSFAVLNGNWASEEVQHCCQGCCSGPEEALAKALCCCSKLLTLACPTPCSKSNWKSWSKCFFFSGLFGSIHNLFQEMMHRLLDGELSIQPFDVGGPLRPPDLRARLHAAAGAGAAEPDVGGVQDDVGEQRGFGAADGWQLQDDAPGGPHAGAGGDADADDIAAMRAQERERKMKVHAFLRTPALWEAQFVLLQTLMPQIALMSKMLEVGSIEWELKEMSGYLNSGDRACALQSLSAHGPLFRSFLQGCGALLGDLQVWSHLLPTQLVANRIVRSVLRSACTIYQLCIEPARRFPERLFHILASDEAAETVASSPKCCRDMFSAQFLDIFPTPVALRSSTCKALLRALLHQVDGHTFSTERLHSRNLRHNKQRVQTFQSDIAWLAAQHVSHSGPAWCKRMMEVVNRQKQASAPPAKRRKKRCNEEAEVGGGRSVRPTSVADADGALQQNKPKKMKRPGGGGPWRAFLHVHKHQVHWLSVVSGLQRPHT